MKKGTPKEVRGGCSLRGADQRAKMVAGSRGEVIGRLLGGDIYVYR